MLWCGFIIYCLLLLILSFIDFKILQLPDELTLSLLWLGLLFNTFNFYTKPSAAILGAALGYTSFFLISKIYLFLRKKEGLGQGDAKLLAALGAWLGWQILPIVILLASMINLSWAMVLFLKHKNTNSLKTRYFPFGPALSFSGIIMLLINILTIK